MSAVCSALAIAAELSLGTLRATAALIGAATFALISDIAARSGSASPASLSSSSRVSGFHSCCSFSLPIIRSAPIGYGGGANAAPDDPGLVALVDVGNLL